MVRLLFRPDHLLVALLTAGDDVERDVEDVDLDMVHVSRGSRARPGAPSTASSVDREWNSAW